MPMPTEIAAVAGIPIEFLLFAAVLAGVPRLGPGRGAPPRRRCLVARRAAIAFGRVA
jgi:hypothetical protein